MQLALDIIFKIELHVVAQIVEAVFIIRSIGDIGRVGFFAADRTQIHIPIILDHMGRVKEKARVMDDRSNGQSKGMINRPHPLHVASGQIVVDRDQMRAAPEQGVEVERQGGHQCLALAGFHLSDAPLMQDNPAKELAVKMAHAGDPTRDFADGRIGFGQDVVKHVGFSLMEFFFQAGSFFLEVVQLLQHLFVRDTFRSNLGRLLGKLIQLRTRGRSGFLDPAAEDIRFRLQFIHAERLQFGFKLADLFHQWTHPLELALVFAPKNLLCQTC